MSDTPIPSALRRQVYERAGGRCEYCWIPDTLVLVAHQVDHIIAEKHGGLTEPDNLALACALCNKHKGSDLTSIDPLTGEIVLLFNPRRDRWLDHFRLVGPLLTPLTATARVTIRLLRLNHPNRIAERELHLAAGLLKPVEPSR